MHIPLYNFPHPSPLLEAMLTSLNSTITNMVISKPRQTLVGAHNSSRHPTAAAYTLPSSKVLHVQRKIPVLVTPAEPTPHEFKPLSDIDDQESLRFQVPVIQYYKNAPDMKSYDPVEVIREALAKALVFYYPFAGRLTEGEERKLIVECSGEGVLFVEADANVKLEDFGDQLPPPLPWIKDLLVEVPVKSNGIIGDPLLLIQVTRLTCGGFIFTCRLNHTMSDAQGLSQFLNAVAEIARGASSPTIHPIWEREVLLSARNPPRITCIHREYDSIPESQRTPFPLPQQLVHKSFFFGPKEITALKNQISFPCTSFEVITASMWRARAIALQLDPNDELRFMFNINVRSRMNPPIPEGYYGNVFVYPCALSTAWNLCESPLSYAVKLVREAKRKATDEYMKSVIDLMVMKGRPPFAMSGAPRVYFVSDNTGAGFADVDYGWGKAVYGGPAAGGFDDFLPGVLSFLVAYKNETGVKGTVVPMCLPEDAMERLTVQVEKLIVSGATVAH